MGLPRLLLYMVMTCWVLCAYKKEHKTKNAIPAASPEQNDLVDVPYGDDGRQKFNIYLPARRSTEKTPVLFFIHGGGWVGGDKNNSVAAIPALRKLLPDYAFVLINYRLYDQSTNSHKFPAQEQDVKTCIEYVLNASTAYKISKNHALWGKSAGAHLAALYAFKHGKGLYPPQALICQAGPMDLLSYYHQSSPEIKTLLMQVVGDPVSSDSLLYKNSSPLGYVAGDNPPTLIMHGTADAIVPCLQAEQLKNKLEEYSVPCVYTLYRGEGHNLNGVEKETLAEIARFLNSYLK
jgi:acetyl esterase/lipase